MSGTLIRKWRVTITVRDKHGLRPERKDFFAVDKKQAMRLLKARYGKEAKIVINHEIKPHPPTTLGRSINVLEPQGSA